MKKRISATIDDSTYKELIKFLKKSKYRNKSHLIEDALLNFLEGKNE